MNLTISAAQGSVSQESPSVVITLIHGTKPFARWPRLASACKWLLRGCRRLVGLESAGNPKETEWYREGSPFRVQLENLMGKGCRITEFEWSGANTEWARLCAAGADHDFCENASSPPESTVRTLRQHIAETRGVPQVLIAHSHAGNLCLAALRDKDTRDAVQSVVCLSTPFINVRTRIDSGILLEFFQFSLRLTYLVALFGTIYLTAQWIPKPWDQYVWVGGFMLVTFLVGIYMALTRRRREALRKWALAERIPLTKPSVSVFLSDGDEALLALKVAEGMNAFFRGLWLVASRIPVWFFPLQRRLGDNLRLALALYGTASLALFGLFLWLDWEILSFEMVAKCVVICLFGPGILLLVWSLILAFPALVALLIAYIGLACLRWLAFGWPGYIDIEMTAETSPLGTSTTTRLESQGNASGLRHGYSYNDPRAPDIIARFIREALGNSRSTRQETSN